MEDKELMPYVARILREVLLKEEKSLAIFEKNINSEDFLTKRQAAGSIPSNTFRIEELKTAINYLKTYKK